MKWTSMLTRTILLGVSLLVFALPPDSKAVIINIGSDTTWTVSDAQGKDLGSAQNFCLNAATPSPCPPGAISYGYPLTGWTANLSAIPGAMWIWAPSITGSTSPAANVEFTFQKEFYLCGAPQEGRIAVAADNSAEVLLNGTSVLSSTNPNVLNTANIPSTSLLQGLNTIQVKVKNGANPPDCGSDQYRCNPAGVVLGGSFADALSALPTCTGNNGKLYNAGQFEARMCPAGQTGVKGRLCVCIGNTGIWHNVDQCERPPTTCTGNNGMTYNVGESESLACPSPKTGLASRTCQSNGSWAAIDLSSCEATCTGNDGRTFKVGESEQLACPSGQVGSKSHTCQATGNWGSTSGTCELQGVCEGCVCGSKEQGQTKTCPSGTTCGPRRIPGPSPDFWCKIFGINCPERLVTADWFCDQ